MNNRDLRITLPLAIAATIILWASAFVGIRAGLESYPPIQLAALRYLVASVILIPIAIVRRIRMPEPKDMLAILGTGILGFTVYNIALNYGEQWVTAASACFIVNGGNLLTALLAAFILKEKVPFATWAGIGVSLVGIGLITVGESSSLIEINRGSFLILLAALSQSAYFILQKYLLVKYTSFELICYSIWIGTLALLLLCGDIIQNIQASSIHATLSVIYLGIFPAVIAYFCWSFVLSVLDASKAAAYLFGVPIITLIIGYLWLQEIPSVLAMAGGVITISGIIVVNSKKWLKSNWSGSNTRLV